MYRVINNSGVFIMYFKCINLKENIHSDKAIFFATLPIFI